ncbi:MAG: SDR family NAD(P)-dependent oxidoreductase, partial [Luteibacter sp.]
MSATQGKVIAITGGSSGIGEATARRLAAGGARVAIGARRTDRLDAIVREIEAAGGSALAIALDVTDRADVAAFVAKAEAAFGPLDV